MKRYWILLCAIVWMMLPLAITAAQDDDTEVYDLIEQAMDALDSGYAYTSETTVTQTFLGEEEGFGTATSQLAEGQIDADENYHVALSLQAGESADAMDESLTFHIEQLFLDGAKYVNFENLDTVYPTIFGEMEDGWHAVDDLIALFGVGSTEELVLQNLTAAALPADFPLTEDMILSVEEQDPTTIDGVDVRVFVLEIDAFQVFMTQNTGNGTFMEQLETILESGDFLEQSEFAQTYTVWIGADDGLLYGGISTGTTKLAYLSADAMGIPYDILTDITSEFTITDHGTVEAITLPAELQS